MNVIGFLITHNPEIKCARDLEDLFSGATVDQTDLEQVILYVRQGIPTIKFMSDVCDTDGKSMGQLMYLTDGEWIWPGYYVYYLAKYPGIKVPKVFIDYVNTKKSVPALSREEMFYAGYMTHKLLTPGFPGNRKPLRKIQHLIEARGEAFICY